MKRYFQNSRNGSFGFVLLFFAGVFFSMFSCTKVEDELGTDFIPVQDMMKLRMDTMKKVYSYTRSVDSIVTDEWGYTYMGSMVQSMFGQTNCDFIGQVVFAGGFSSSDSLWGDQPAIDSAFISLAISGYWGDTLENVVVDVYRMNKPLPYLKDSSYYSNFDAEPYIDPTPIATMNVTGNTESAYVKIPNEVAERYLDTTDMIYVYDTLFHKRHPGYFFKARKTMQGGNIYSVDLTNSNIFVYYHNKNVPVADTSYVMFAFDNGDESYNEAFTMISHDFTYASALNGVNPKEIDNTSEPQKLTYIQSLGGLMTEVEVLQEEIDRIKKQAEAEGYSRVSINNATLIATIDNPIPERLDWSPSRLGIFYNYNDFTLIPDYYPYDVDDTTPMFGGYINRAKMCYSMNITTWIQQLFTGATEEKKVDLTVGYGFESIMAGVALEGVGSETPLQIAITYTMVK